MAFRDRGRRFVNIACRVGDLRAPALPLEDSQLVGASITILDPPYVAIGGRLFSGKMEHHVDHVLQELRTGYLAILRDVSDQDNGAVRGFRFLHHGLGHRPDLPRGSGPARAFRVSHCLDTVEDRKVETGHDRQDFLHSLPANQGKSPIPRF